MESCYVYYSFGKNAKGVRWIFGTEEKGNLGLVETLLGKKTNSVLTKKRQERNVSIWEKEKKR